MALLVAISMVNCKSGDAPAPAAGSATAPAGAFAGKVLEVAGKVTVKGKPLAVGDQLQADDVVETGDDGHVVIELTHNLAHWELGGNKSQKVSESIAWKLPKSDGNAGITIRDMSASGRPAERSASNTEATAGAPAPPAPDNAPAPAHAAPAPVAQPAPPKTMAAAPMGRDDAKADKAVPPPPPPPPPAPSGGAVKGKNAEDMIEHSEAALKQCLPMGSKVTIHVAVDAAGKATTTVDDAPDAKSKSCIVGVVGKLSLPKEKASVSMTIEKSTH
jgi:hypothetical protein